MRAQAAILACIFVVVIPAALVRSAPASLVSHARLRGKRVSHKLIRMAPQRGRAERGGASTEQHGRLNARDGYHARLS